MKVISSNRAAAAGQRKDARKTLDEFSVRVKRAALLANKMINAHDDVQRHKVCGEAQSFLESSVYAKGADMTEVETEHKLIYKGVVQMILQCEPGETLDSLYKFAASPITLLGPVEVKFSYVKGLAHHICKEYKIIDHYYMEKILSLLRVFLQSIFAYLKLKKWDAQQIDLFKDSFSETFFNTNPGDEIPVDLIFHIADIYIDEILKANGGKKIRSKTVVSLLLPYLKIIAKSSNVYAVNYIRKVIFNEIAEHADREVIQYHTLMEFDLDVLINEIEAIAKSKTVHQSNREILYSIIKKLEFAKSNRMAQVDLKHVQHDSEDLATSYVDNLKNLADGALLDAARPANADYIPSDGAVRNKKRPKISFSKKQEKIKDKIRAK